MIAFFKNGKNLQVHVAQKAGNTSIKNYLSQCFGLNQHYKQLGKERKIILKDFLYVPTEKIHKKIAIIRDPVERLHSAYIDRVVYHNRNKSRDTIKSWEDFVLNLEEYLEQFPDVAQHCRKQVEYLLEDDIDTYDAIFHTYDIKDGVRKYIESIAEVSIKPAHSKNRKTYNIDYSKDKKIIDKIKNFYTDDYAYFKNHLKEKI